MSVRFCVTGPDWLGPKRVFQKPVLPEKKARLVVPASRAASMLARCAADQYSSCPLETNSRCWRSSAGLLFVSMLEM